MTMNKLLLLSMIGLSLAACDATPPSHDAAATGSPGVQATANLPPTANNAGTGSSDMNTSLAEVGGQLPDSSNPTPAGLPGASAVLN
jgi:hypothetical protein